MSFYAMTQYCKDIINSKLTYKFNVIIRKSQWDFSKFNLNCNWQSIINVVGKMRREQNFF